ncbi:Predicted xylanase/chitin deacetylase [Aquiflexum balticum DSM 16537]|uniref:Predicted xylanase/chitin deacetylase n=1 Tax=Aquiflexum balticum DSM 16537 TaxID=758820 RepID=A0A1W2HC23_9BACT|nr:polysaccharide deacetylase family protein [Aquiflexum balticum]SMD46321.1 Predicted xylanase/chitin deacetylase [Aquiflexum balticum DSM 16537]
MKKPVEWLIKIIGFVIWHSAWIQHILIYLSGNRFRILYYHLVADEIPDYYFKNKGISVTDFKRQVKFYKKFYKFISLDEAIRLHDSGSNLKGYICLTTDDGFKQNYTTIAQILFEENIPATFFILPEMVDNKKLMWRNKLAVIQNSLTSLDSRILMHSFAKQNNLSLPKKNEKILSWTKRVFSMKDIEWLSDEFWKLAGMPDLNQYMEDNKPYLSKEQMLKLQEMGFSFGSHTLSHPYCNKLDFSELEHEIGGSVRLLSEILNSNINHFAYPFGVRPNPDLERKLIDGNLFGIVSLSGISNRLDNSNPLKWERDQQETGIYFAMFRFFVLPFFRKFIRKK